MSAHGEERNQRARDRAGQHGEREEEPGGDVSRPGFYIYIGPNIKKHIQTGTIYRGTRANALKQAAEAIKAYPLVKTLIVSGDALPEARLKVKAPGNALYANYMKLKLAGKEGK